MNYQRALDLIFESFIAAKPFIKGRLDRHIRNPYILLGVAEELNILPLAQNVIKITGSKGKGTVARLIAHTLQANHNVGLIVSPEEIDHLDRLRINGRSISHNEFIDCFQIVWQATQTIRQNLSPPQYLSPYGLFLLIGLVWFKTRNVDTFIIETGRGVRFDEGGQIEARIGVVTSIFKEHAAYLGPTLKEIEADKLSIHETCEQVILGQRTTAQHDMPAWYVQSQQTAQHAMEAFLGHRVALPHGPCASFGKHIDDQGRTLIYEGMIASQSADMNYLQKLVDENKGKVLFLVSLSDDKDVARLSSLLEKTGAQVSHIILKGARGFLSYEKTRSRNVIYEGPYDAPGLLREGLDTGAAQIIYFIGTQTYLRLVKQAFFL